MRFDWLNSHALARAYLDQLARGSGIARDRTQAIARELAAAEGQSGAGRRTALTTLATQLDADARTATDANKVRMLATAVRDLANATR